ncbi:MAG TPA: VWA domain-containing protein [Dongiaceae bacterium]|nr:VWA domain-containing protein [Dongiaceae bacterium]
MTEFFEQLAQFHFLRPAWLLAILPASLLVVLLWRRKASFGLWEKVVSPHLLPHLMQGNVGNKNQSALVLLLIAWVLASLALAGPTWRKLPTAAQKKIEAQVIVLDLSVSMYAADLPPSRLQRARMKLTDILKRADEGLTALVVFAGTPHVVTPLTDDANTIQSMVASLDPNIMPIKGSDPAAAVKRALDVFRQGGVEGGRILLITDSVPENFVATLEPVINADTFVSILGVGTPEGAPIPLDDGTFVKDSNGNIAVPRLDVDALKKAARQLGGRFSTLSSNDADIDYLLARVNPFGDQQVKDTHREFDVWDEFGPWLVVLLLPLAAAGYRRGWLGALLLPVLASILTMTPRPAQAFEWADLWTTPDQQAQALLGEGQAAEAAKKFTRPDWKGASAYKGGDSESAAEQFRQQKDADGYYNLGNSLTELGQYDDAIAAYDKSLELNPDDEDARANREIANKRKQQQQEQQNGDGQQDPNKKNDSSNSDQNKDKKQDQQQDSQQQQNDQQQADQQKDGQQDQQQADQNQQNQDQQNKQSQDPQKEQPDPQAPAQKPDSSKQEQDQNQPQKPQSDEGDQEGDEQPPQSMPFQTDPLQSEDQQALEQWLRRVPDDPGGLLRRKFERETQLRKAVPGGDNSW